MENYDIFKKFLKKPLVKRYIQEIFLPNKEIKSFQISKIKGIYEQIKDDIKSLLDRLNMDLFIPDTRTPFIFGMKPENNTTTQYTSITDMLSKKYGNKLFVAKIVFKTNKKMKRTTAIIISGIISLIITNNDTPKNFTK